MVIWNIFEMVLTFPFFGDQDFLVLMFGPMLQKSDLKSWLLIATLNFGSMGNTSYPLTQGSANNGPQAKTSLSPVFV